MRSVSKMSSSATANYSFKHCMDDEIEFNCLTNNEMPMAKTKIGSWLASRDWKSLTTFLVRWVLAPATAVVGYVGLENSDAIINFLTN